MKIANPRQFGNHLMKLRKEAGITLDQMADRVEWDKMAYWYLETGKMGDLKEEFLEDLTEKLPKFSLALAPGVQEPPVHPQELDRDEFVGRGKRLSGEPTQPQKAYANIDDALKNWKPT